MQNLSWMALFLQMTLFFSAVWDLFEHRIPNYYNLFGIFISLFHCVLIRGAKGLPGWFAVGAGILLCLIPFYQCHFIGAGDMKLLVVLGTFLMPDEVLTCMLHVFLVGALFSLILIISSRIIRWPIVLSDIEKLKTLAIPFAVPIFIGAVFWGGGSL